MDEAITAMLNSYMRRVGIRPGNGLSRSMNNHLRSYPAIPDIIRRVIVLLLRTELLFNCPGTVRMKPVAAYRALLTTEDDWVQVTVDMHAPTVAEIAWSLAEAEADVDDAIAERLDHGAFAGTVRFVRRARKEYSLPAFHAEMSIARRIGLLAGHGHVGIAPAVREKIRRDRRATIAS